MKILKLTTLSLVVALTACQTNQTVNIGGNMSKPTVNQEISMTEQLLSGTWQLIDNPLTGSNHKPLTLHFDNGEVSVLNGCNNIRASYQIESGQLKVGSPISTRMMCEPNLMALDNLATQVLAGKISLEKSTDDVPENTYLKMTVNNQHYQLVKVK